MGSNNEVIHETQKKAEIINKHFESIGKALPLSNKYKEKIKDLKSKEKAHTASPQVFEESFSLAELNRAMKKLKKRKAPGPDKLHNEVLINLEETGCIAI